MSVENNTDDDKQKDVGLKRILWRCRRGTKELDLILSGFAHTEYPRLTLAEQQRFNELLDVQDPVLTQWLCFNNTVDQEFEEMVVKIIQHKNKLIK